MFRELYSITFYRQIPLLAIAGCCYEANLNFYEFCWISKHFLEKIIFPGCSKNPHGLRCCFSVYGKLAYGWCNKLPVAFVPTSADCSVLQIPDLRVLDNVVFVQSALTLIPGTDIQ